MFSLESVDIESSIFVCAEYQFEIEVILFLRDGRKILVCDVSREDWEELVRNPDHDSVVALIKAHYSEYTE